MTKMNSKEALSRAQDIGEVFLCSLTREQLEKTGFDTSTFGPFEFVDIYLQWVGDEFQLKYVFDSDPRQSYYERVRDVGHDVFASIIDSYLERLDSPAQG